jgi:hypothetical protein
MPVNRQRAPASNALSTASPSSDWLVVRGSRVGGNGHSSRESKASIFPASLVGLPIPGFQRSVAAAGVERRSLVWKFFQRLGKTHGPPL